MGNENLNFKTIPENKNWVVLHTKSRREKKVSEFCNKTGISNYLPLEHRYKQYGRKKVAAIVPLFSGYLFCCCSEKDRYDLLMTHQIARVIPVVDQFSLLHDLEKIYLAQHAGMNLKSSQHFNNGQKVKILTGPLIGYEGIIQKIKGKKRLVLIVDFIQQAASIEIDQFMVKVLN